MNKYSNPEWQPEDPAGYRVTEFRRPDRGEMYLSNTQGDVLHRNATAPSLVDSGGNRWIVVRQEKETKAKPELRWACQYYEDDDAMGVTNCPIVDEDNWVLNKGSEPQVRKWYGLWRADSDAYATCRIVLLDEDGNVSRVVAESWTNNGEDLPEDREEMLADYTSLTDLSWCWCQHAYHLGGDGQCLTPECDCMKKEVAPF